MKVRIANNSIRFRLKQPEVAQFFQHKSITEVLSLGGAITEQLQFTLTTGNHTTFSIVYSEQAIVVSVPGKVVQEWVMTDLEGIKEEINTGNGKTVLVLIEKDFACLDKAAEENEGAYPNPKANC